MRVSSFTAAVALVVCAMPAAASEWAVDEDASKIGFEYMRGGAPARGVFHDFRGSGTFDPAAPKAARLKLIIDTTSIDLGEGLASAFATSAEWFDSKNHPNVAYELTGLTPLGGDHFRATGALTIRGKTKPITSDIDIDIEGDTARAKGTLTIDRYAYLLGVGPAAAFVTIGRQVEVTFDLAAHPIR